MRHSAHLMAVVGAVALAGCGLADQLNPLKNGIGFQIPMQSFSVDTSDPRWKQPPASGVPNVPCGSGANAVIMDCCMPAPGTSIDCTRYPLTCEAGTCALKFAYEQPNTIDLGKQAPELKTVGGQILSDVMLTQIDLGIANGINTAVPPIDLYVAPGSVQHADGKGAQKIATIPSIPAGFRGQMSVPLDPAGQQAFSNFAKDFQTPFNVIMSTIVTVRGGQEVPRGRLDVNVGGHAMAHL